MLRGFLTTLRVRSTLRRGYSSRADMEMHLASMQNLINSTTPAKFAKGFKRRSKIVCTLGPRVANPPDLDVSMRARVYSRGEGGWGVSRVCGVTDEAD